MRKHLAVTSVVIFILTILILQFFGVGKVSGATGTNILLFGFGSAVLLAAFSEKGRLKTMVLSLYGFILLAFIILSILFGVAHM